MNVGKTRKRIEICSQLEMIYWKWRWN